MPKEFIHNRYYGQTAVVHEPDGCMAGKDHDLNDCPGKRVEIDNSVLKIGWSRDAEHVELAVCESEGGVFVEHGYEHEVEEGKFVGQTGPRYIQMDRAGLNRLIRSLRKARDAAFGADA